MTTFFEIGAEPEPDGRERRRAKPASAAFSPRGWIQRFIRPITVPYKDVARVERLVPPSWLHFAEGLRFRSEKTSWDRLYFSASPRRIATIVESLENRGIEVR